jgi:ABC-2 type transport system permease protein
MNALSLTIRDSATMLRRDLVRSLRIKAMTLSAVVTPLIFLVLFNYVYGGAIGAGLGGGAHAGPYINYIVPAIIIMVVGYGCSATAVNLTSDLSEGVITRFRTMAIARSSVLIGQVASGLIRTLVSVGLVIAVAWLMGFRPSASPSDWALALGVIALASLALTCMGLLFGLVGKTPAGANSLSLLFQILILTSSAFVSTASMSGVARAFAEYQPFTPVIDSIRGLLLGAPMGNSAILAVAWLVGLSLIGYLAAQAVYNRDPVR